MSCSNGLECENDEFDHCVTCCECKACLTEIEEEEENDKCCCTCDYTMTEQDFDAGRGRIMFSEHDNMTDDGKYVCGMCDGNCGEDGDEEPDNY